MRVSEAWLREWISPDLDITELASLLTNSGLEVASIDRAGPDLDPQIVVGIVRSISSHPASARLRICEVDAGRRHKARVVCGAPNVRTGGIYPLALPGARLEGGGEVQVVEIQGETSEGMLCSSAELGLDEDASGLLELDRGAVAGSSVNDALGLDDRVIEIELTPNRGDCMSIAGIARELRVLTGARVRLPRVPTVEAVSRQQCDIRVESPESCPRYVGRAVESVGADVATPLWIRERLRRSGIRSLSLIVDITNYVMLELGQPMHAFDLERIRGGIVVRMAREGERLILLDGSEAGLTTNMLVIADHERPIGLAGIMGGEESAIHDGTRHIVFEAAFFAPAAIAGRARELGLQTESSQRFERGVDPMLQRQAMERACSLLTSIAGGEPGRIVEASSRRHLPERRPVRLRRERLARMLGEDLPARQVRTILGRIGEGCASVNEGWKLTPPSHRFDLAAEWDLVEEVARVHGLARLPSRLPAIAPGSRSVAPKGADVRRATDRLVDLGYQEVVSYSFVDPETQALVNPGPAAVRLRNPIAANLAVMRETLWVGLVATARTNLHRQHRRLRLFEVGRTYHGSGEQRSEIRRIAGLATGPVDSLQWGVAAREVDFHDLKGDVEMLMALGGSEETLRFEPLTDDPTLHPGQAAAIRRHGHAVGRLGQLHPRVAGDLDFEQPVFVFEIELDALAESAAMSYRPVSRFPSVRRDLALVVEESVPAAALLDTVREAAGDCLRNLELFDVYRGKGLDSGRKSIAIALTLQESSRTLTEEEATRILDGVVRAAGVAHAAVLRA